MNLRKWIRIVVAGITLQSAFLVGAGLAQGASPLNAEEKELLRVEDNVLTVRRALSAARRRGDDPEKVEKLQKKYDKLQKKRVGLLRATWKM